MNQIIKAETVDFQELVATSKSDLSFLSQSYMVDLLNCSFDEEESRWYVANLYMYLHYHPTNDYPINLEDVYKMLGFANKGNAKRTLVNNFTIDEDYKNLLLPREKQVKINGGAGLNNEKIMLNVDTFKNLCMIAKTEQGKKIRKYYVKLENIYNKIIKEELENKDKLLEEMEEKTNKLVEEKDKDIQNHKAISLAKDKYIEDLKNIKPQLSLYIGVNPDIKNLYKIGITDNSVLVREDQHKTSNPGFEILYTLETKNAKQIETIIKLFMKPYKDTKPEWFKTDYETFKSVVDFCILLYDNYQIDCGLQNLMSFINKYKLQQILTTKKIKEQVITEELFKEYADKNFVYGDNYKTPSIMIYNDFLNWYMNKFPNKDISFIKKTTFSNTFKECMKYNIVKVTGKDFIFGGLTLVDTFRNINHTNVGGFIGFTIKSYLDIDNYFDNEIYKKYILEHIKVVDNQLYKVPKTELSKHFIDWIETNNFTCEGNFKNSLAFNSFFYKKITELTGINVENVITNRCTKGSFIGMKHTFFHKMTEDEKQKIYIKIKPKIEILLDPKNTKILANVVKMMINNNNFIYMEEIDKLYTNKNIFLRNENALIFNKTSTGYTFSEEALDVINNNKN